MFKHKVMAAGIALALSAPWSVQAADSELAQIREQIKQMKDGYEARISALESRLKQAEATAGQAQAKAERAEEKAVQAASAPTAQPPAAANAFNPEVSLILSGTYTNASQTRDPESYRITGFVRPTGAEIGPGERGLSLKESELVVAANIDPHFRGHLTLAMTPEDTVAVEEAFIHTLGLRNGFTLKAGRFLSGVGYLNEHHAHTWDFADAPLVHQAFLGGQLKDDGVQLRWLAPTDTFVELGAELGRGRNYPGSNRNKNGIGSTALFAHVGGDVGISNSWRAGLSWLQSKPEALAFNATDSLGVEVANRFSGTSRLSIADFVWKWSPNGNATHTNFKLQGEYFRRRESGNLTYDTDAASTGTNTDRYITTQSGAYLQGVYQFMPRWRVGLRRDQLSSGSLDYASNNANLDRPAFNPTKNSLMFDYSPSEFSRIRLQFAQDKARQGITDNQLFLQYQMSLGTHGAHTF